MSKESHPKKESDARDPTYFQYYAQFVHQANMLQDQVRTSMYYSAIVYNGPTLFQDKIVMDLGAGSGILSYFAAQAGAAHVFAVEASNMALKIQKLLKACPTKNPSLHNKITVLSCELIKINKCIAKIEDLDDLPRVDTIVSEPIGVFLVHERMIESYLYARDHCLKPGGTMVPSTGTIYVAPFTDGNLWTLTMAKVRFWEQTNFYGVDLTPLVTDARDEIFGQPVVGGFDEKQLLAAATPFLVDFEKISIDELKEFVIPFSWVTSYTGIIHGIASWFDINLSGYVLSTAPNLERTHWHQVRLLFKEPLAVNAFQTVRGWLHFIVNPMRSYDITVEVVLGADAPLSTPPKGKAVTSAISDGHIRRFGQYSLHEQSYHFDSQPLAENSKPEILGLYQPEDTLAEEMGVDGSK